MNPQLLLVHGRGQAGKDPTKLKSDWITALEAGAKAGGREFQLQEEDVRFAYYGDTLDDLVGREELIADVITRGTLPAGGAQALAWQASVLDEIRTALGISDDEVASLSESDALDKGVLNWPWVRAILRTIDQHVGYASGASIYLFTHDVYHYLTNPGAIQLIESSIMHSVQPAVPTVVVGHSLGSIVAYNLLRNRSDDLVVPLFVTLGSPLAVKRIKMALAPIKHPAGVGSWFNAMDPRDIVSLYPLDGLHFPVDPPIENKTVANRTDDRHGIEGYLEDAEVAGRILDALQT